MLPFKYFINLMFLWFVLGLVPTQLNAADATTPTTELAAKLKKLKVAPNETALFVGDMHCKTCAKKVAGKLYAVKGVMKVRTNVKEDVAIITPQQKKNLDVNALWKAAQTAGFPPVKLIGPQGTYIADPKTKAAQRLPGTNPAATKQG